jgi:hypothetical protein
VQVDRIKLHQNFCGQPVQYLVWTQRTNNFLELVFAVYVSCAAALFFSLWLYQVEVVEMVVEKMRM